MSKTPQQNFWAIPDWAKTGPIDAENYEYRALAHCGIKSKEREGEHPVINRNSPTFLVWQEYFDRWLKGRPPSFRRLIEYDGNGEGPSMTVPEPVPQWFDPSFKPTEGWRPPPPTTKRLTAYRPERLGDRPSSPKFVEHQPTAAELAEEVLRQYREAAERANSAAAEKPPEAAE